ncbi:MAG: phosphatase PAP2 family protein [Gammaproteobacteria bacterium]|nr:phosphatase PAP2 family protein [Gammaproteobacteria bacterium]
METLLAPLLEWLQQHPHWAGFTVFLTAFLESLLVVGLFMPGAVLMFGFGALVATGVMELWPTLLWAVLGAIAGDGISFFIGRHFHQRLRVMWPFYKHPRLMARGVDFFHHHGGKSIILARFVGPVRPILPAVAGMLNMGTGRFFLFNSFSALLWAPIYLLPGLVFGASLGLAAEVAGRLALLFALLIILLWFSLWLVWRLLRLLQPHASYWMARTLDWSRRHPRLHPLAAGLLDPNHPEARALTLLTLLLLAASWGFLLTLQQILGQSTLAGLDPLVFNLLQDLRTPFADRVMVFITLLGDGRLLTLLVAGMALWLALKGRWKASLHWLAAFAITSLLTRVLKISSGSTRPLDLGPDMSLSFPSGHAAMSVAAYGFLALLVAGELSWARRWIPYLVATLLCVPIAFSRLYLGAHWLSDVLAGLTLGLFWVALMGIAYRTHPGPAVSLRPLLWLGLALLLVLGGWHIQQQFQPRLERYQPQRSVQQWTFQDWQAGNWSLLPDSRRDLEGHRHHPLNLQWAGELEDIAHWLDARGWQEPPRLSLRTLLPEFAADPALELLPVTPQVHDGHHDDLRRARYLPGGEQLLVLRLWPAGVELTPEAPPLWIGNVTLVERQQSLGLITTLRTGTDFRTPFELWREQIGQWPEDTAWEWRMENGARPMMLLWPGNIEVEAGPR